MKHNSTQGGRSVRTLRVGEEIRHVLAEVLMRGEVHDDVLDSHPVTVSEVRVSPDLRHATVFVEPLGGQDEELVLGALRRRASYLKGLVGKRIRLKFVPNLHFHLDESFGEASHIGKVLQSDKVRQDLQGPPIDYDEPARD